MPPVRGTGSSKVPAPLVADWVSYHLVSHTRRDELLSRLARPVLHELYSGRLMTRFFFIRYELGGPHIRLRLFCAPGYRTEVDRIVRARAEEFFRRCPSTSSLDEEAVREQNRWILRTDPEAEDVVHADNSILEVPFRSETERYGGRRFFDFSLLFFEISSAHALLFLESHRETATTRFLAWAMRSLVRQAIGFAAGGKEFLRLLAYAGEGSAIAHPVVLARADQAFEQEPEKYVQLIREEIENSCSPEPSLRLGDYLLTEAARRLRASVREARPPARAEILMSQLHMTANRLGMKNPEEAYLGRILWRAAQEISRADPPLLRRLRGSGAERNRLKKSSLEEIAQWSLDELFASSGRGRAQDQRRQEGGQA
jgi:hypothetical protein